ncbi:hypothetical protein LINPERPRIM_LOCUS36105 [Linum perenne]
MRLMLERAMGRASSTLSPGHRHFASQAKELIAEIELLEQEVNNREQQVLSLYRTIFDQCVTSKPSSGQQSSSTSTVPSPSHQHHPKQLSSSSNKKQHHPRIISTAFCSSKMFPLRSLHSLVSSNGSSERRGGPSRACSTQTEQKTLKEHLRRQCPSKLSEEMVKCMAGVYCWLCTSGAGADQNNNPLIKKDRSPLLSRSSTNVVLPRRSGGENNVDYWSCKSTVEVCWISTDQRRYSSASYAIDHYRVLVEQLEAVTVTQMETNAQIAFWINVYNSLVMHAYLAYGIPNSSLKRLALFHKLRNGVLVCIVQAAYNVGGHIVSASTIEQSIFCFRSPRVGKWLETVLSTALRKKSSEERRLISSSLALPSPPHSLACFALCTGAFSDPVLRVYSSSNVKEELEVAKREFLQSNILVKKSKKVFLPKLLERYAKEEGIGSSDLLKWVVKNVDKKLRDSIEKCFVDHKLCKKKKKVSQVIEWLPYSSRFRYVFSKDLTEKPWWV